MSPPTAKHTIQCYFYGQLCCPFFYSSQRLNRRAASWRLCCFQERWLQQLQSQSSRKSVNLLYVELAHEINSFRGNHLTGHHDREAGRIWNNKVGGDERRSFFKAAINLCTGKF